MSAWNLSGTVLIACNCDWGCPCNFNARPSRGFCEGGWCWLIEHGSVDGVPVDGLGVAVFAEWPGAIHEGGGRAVAFLDESADAAQRNALTRLVRGEIGGPWSVFSNTYELADPEPAAFTLDAAAHRSRLRIGDAVHLQLTPIRNPVTGAEVHPEIVLPEGLVVKHASVGASEQFRVDAGIAYDHSGQYTAFARFSYEGALAGG